MSELLEPNTTNPVMLHLCERVLYKNKGMNHKMEIMKKKTT